VQRTLLISVAVCLLVSMVPCTQGRASSLSALEYEELYRWLVRAKKDCDRMLAGARRDLKPLAFRSESEVLIHDTTLINEWRPKDHYKATFTAHSTALRTLLLKMDFAGSGFKVGPDTVSFLTVHRMLDSLRKDLEVDAGKATRGQLENALEKLRDDKLRPLSLHIGKLLKALEEKVQGAERLSRREGGKSVPGTKAKSPESKFTYIWLVRAEKDLRRLEAFVKTSNADAALAGTDVLIHEKSGLNEWCLHPQLRCGMKALREALEGCLKRLDMGNAGFRLNGQLVRASSLTQLLSGFEKGIEDDWGDADAHEYEKAKTSLAEKTIPEALALVEALKGWVRMSCPDADLVDRTEGLVASPLPSNMGKITEIVIEESYIPLKLK